MTKKRWLIKFLKILFFLLFFLMSSVIICAITGLLKYGYFAIHDTFEENIPMIIPFFLAFIFYPPLLLASIKLYSLCRFILYKLYFSILMSIMGIEWFLAIILVLSTQWKTIPTLSLIENMLSGELSVPYLSLLTLSAIISISVIHIVCFVWISICLLIKAAIQKWGVYRGSH